MIDVNGTTLYYEWRGQGPSALFNSGATGDAGSWTAVGTALADEYTVIAYDRRGNSRSPCPPGWTSTTTDEQADDDAGLIRALDLAPALAFSTSAAFESLDPRLREGLLGNGDVLFGLGMKPLLGWEPALEELASVRLPCLVMAGAENRDPHTPCFTRPAVFAEALRPLLDTLASPRDL